MDKKWEAIDRYTIDFNGERFNLERPVAAQCAKHLNDYNFAPFDSLNTPMILHEMALEFWRLNQVTWDIKGSNLTWAGEYIDDLANKVPPGYRLKVLKICECVGANLDGVEKAKQIAKHAIEMVNISQREDKDNG